MDIGSDGFGNEVADRGTLACGGDNDPGGDGGGPCANATSRRSTTSSPNPFTPNIHHSSITSSPSPTTARDRRSTPEHPDSSSSFSSTLSSRYSDRKLPSVSFRRVESNQSQSRSPTRDLTLEGSTAPRSETYNDVGRKRRSAFYFSIPSSAKS